MAALNRGGFDVTSRPPARARSPAATSRSEDFAFPAGVPAAEKIRRDHPGSTAFVPFYTPMAIATWKPIVDLLQAAGVVHQPRATSTLDVAAYMQLVDKNTRWKDLPGNTTYPVNKSILITSTDVRRSNSAAMYLSLASATSRTATTSSRTTPDVDRDRRRLVAAVPRARGSSRAAPRSRSTTTSSRAWARARW